MKTSAPRTALLSAMLALLLALPATVPAQPQTQAPDRGSKSLREAVGRNELVSLKSIMDWIEEHYEGQVIEAELENQAGFFGYEIDLLTPTGSKIEFQFNARTGELLSVSGRDIEKARRK